MKLLKPFSLLLLMTCPLFAFAGGANSGPRTIISIGCHLGSNACYADVDGAYVGPAGCVSNSIRWDPTASGGKENLSLLTAAYMAGKKVSFFVSDSCFTGQTMYPTFFYTNLTN